MSNSPVSTRVITFPHVDPSTSDTTRKLDYSLFTWEITVSTWHSKCHRLPAPSFCFLGAGVALLVRAGRALGACSLWLLATARVWHAARLSESGYQLDQAFKCSLDYFCSRPREVMEFLFLVLQYDLLTTYISHAVGIEVSR